VFINRVLVRPCPNGQLQKAGFFVRFPAFGAI
jgi:hypothetical protein